MKVFYSTQQYEASHDHAPRGRGSWAFEVEEIDGVLADRSLVWARGTWTEAKAQLRAWLVATYPSAEAITVEVLP